MTPALQLESGLEELGLSLPQATRVRLLDYLALLAKWNRVYNLTAIREMGSMVAQHLLDSLSVLTVVGESALTGRRWADVGSGAGLPGIPLAIARPNLGMTLVETVEKKSAFQRQAAIELRLANVEVVNSRVEDIPGGAFDAVVSRAFAGLGEFVRLAGHLVAADGRLYAMKGAPDADELNGIPPGWEIVASHPLRIPGIDARRRLIVIRKV